MDLPEIEPNQNENLKDDTVENEQEIEEDASEAESFSEIQSIQVAPTDQSQGDIVLNDEDDPMLRIELGDNIRIVSGRFGKVDGTVYYRSLERICVKPIGVSNMLSCYGVEQTDEGEIFNEEDDVKEVIVVDKRNFPAFVLQQDFRVGQIVDTFEASGNLYKRYKISHVNKENDYITIMEINDGEVDESTASNVEFRFIGIDPDEPFQIISIYQYELPSASVNDEKEPSPVDSVEQDIEQEPVEEEEEYEYIGEIRVVLPKIIREIASYEQMIPDEVQKVDALNDFINNMDLSVQKNQKMIRQQRMLVETLDQLKRETISYYSDGSIRGPKTVSALTLSDLIQLSSIPLGRPVLTVTKKGYYYDEDDKTNEMEDTEEFFFQSYETELTERVKNIQTIISNPTNGKMIREWSDRKRYLETYLSPWSADGKEEPIWSALTDSEFFRNSPPALYELSENNYELVPAIEGFLASHDEEILPIFSKIPFGMERALGITYRKGEDRRKQVFMNEDRASLFAYLFFPIQTAPYLGAKRTYFLAADSGRSQMTRKTMKTILQEVGDPKLTGGTSRDIILLDTSSQSYGHILIEEYVKGLTIPALGLGDTYQVLHQYGLGELELNQQIATVLQTKIGMYQDQLISSLSSLRRTIKEMKPSSSQPYSLLDQPNFLAVIKSQSLLLQAIEDYERYNPSMASLDIGIVNHLLKYHSNFFQVTAGNNPFYITKGFYEENNNQYHQQLKINHMKKMNRKNSGKPPKRNRCPHVADMVSVRKIKDDEERFYHLTRIFRKYQGVKKENWYHCNICKDHLLCIHERLQLQAYLNPVEKSVIEKEIVLKCSGGQFQGSYICRNCGQTLRELGFDNHIEFDDEGRPKSGRAVLQEDKEILLEERIDLLHKDSQNESEKESLNLVTQEEKECYEVVRELSERVGIQLDQKGYQFIIQQVLLIISKFPNESMYGRIRQKMPNLPVFSIAYSRKYVALCAVFLLIEIQTKVPSYKIHYALKGCPSPGFDGYPLVEDKEKKQGLEYMTCAISTIRRSDGYFYQTGFHLIPDPSKRSAAILKYLSDVIESDVIKLPIVQSNLLTKRSYIESIGSDESVSILSGPRDQIPVTFLPEQMILSPEDAAKDVISPEVVQHMGTKGKTSLVKLWIRQGHQLAIEHAKLIRGSPLSETSCCFHSIQSPSSEWKKDELPPLWKREIVPYQQGQKLVTEFIPREADMAVAKSNPELFYRIFLKYCFQGPHLGQPHQPGLTHRCNWCGFQFPTHPKLMTTQQGRDAMANQPDIDTSEEGFTALLDAIHQENKVDSTKQIGLSSVETIMNEFADMVPPPSTEWSSAIRETTRRFITLPKHADRSDLVAALSTISNLTESSKQLLKTYLSTKGSNQLIYDTLDEIAQLSWMNFFQVIQTYFITVIQRLLSGYSDKALFVPIELIRELSDIHVQKDLTPILESDTTILKQYMDQINKPVYVFARSKLIHFVKQLQSLIAFKNKIRATLVPGKGQTLAYIQQTILYSTIATLVNPDYIPDESIIDNPQKSSGTSSTKFIIQLIVSILSKYRRESLSYDDEQIRIEIATREEKERVHVVNEFNDMTEDERQIEVINKKLGIGKWAVGGTSLTWKYNREFYDIERARREMAGMEGYPDQMGKMDEMGRELDEMGFPKMNEAEVNEAEDGYDFRDDYD